MTEFNIFCFYVIMSLGIISALCSTSAAVPPAGLSHMARMMDSLIIEPFPPFAFTKITTTTHRSSGRNNPKKTEVNGSNGSASGTNGGTSATASATGNRTLGSSVAGLFAGQSGSQGAAVGVRLKSRVPTQGNLNGITFHVQIHSVNNAVKYVF